MNEGIHIRDAVESDLPGLLGIQKAAFMRYTKYLLPEQMPPVTETLEGVRDDFLRKRILIAEFGGALAGSVRYSAKGGVCLIERLSVDPALQGRGIGSSLVREVERRVGEKVHKIYLETGLLADNLLMFYAKLGYSGEAVLRKHYGGFDWIVLSKFIYEGQGGKL